MAAIPPDRTKISLLPTNSHRQDSVDGSPRTRQRRHVLGGAARARYDAGRRCTWRAALGADYSVSDTMSTPSSWILRSSLATLLTALLFAPFAAAQARPVGSQPATSRAAPTPATEPAPAEAEEETRSIRFAPQPETPLDEEVESQVEASPEHGVRGVPPAATARPSPPVYTRVVPWPSLDPTTLAWFAAIVILVLTFQTSPLFSLRNVDGLVLAAMCFLLLHRSNVAVEWGDRSAQWWSYLLLTLAAAYWLIRGLLLSRSRSTYSGVANLPEGATFILILAGMALGLTRIASEPLTGTARDAFIGGMYTAASGKLPYGDADGYDTHGPLLYLLHAGAIRVLPPMTIDGERVVVMNWKNRETWLQPEAWELADLSAPRLVHGFLFIAMLFAVFGIGRHQHSMAMGLKLVAIFCIFPGVLECLTRGEILLPATLMTWGLALAVLPGFGPLIAMLMFVLAGLAWPWAWLAIPIALGYFFRRGLHGLVGVVALLGGAAGVVLGLTALTSPSLPRARGALKAAGLTAKYVATAAADGAIVIAPAEPGAAPAADFKSPLWRFLLDRETAVIDSRRYSVKGSEAGGVRFRDIDAPPQVRAELQGDYREALLPEHFSRRILPALRTVLEATWLAPIYTGPPIVGAWRYWTSPTDAVGQQRTSNIRRGAKIGIAIISLLIAASLARSPTCHRHQFAGAMLVLCSAVLVASEPGAATNWIWLMPAALAALGAKSPEPPPSPAAQQVAQRLAGGPPSPAPRITVER
jgi:hypothetical protein